MIQIQVQWNLERASLIGTCWELNCEILRNAGHFGPGLICLGLFIQVISDLVGGSFGQFSEWVISAFGCFGQSLKMIMYALLYVYERTDGQVLSFVKKSGWNVKRALPRLRLKQPLSKCPGRGQNDLLTLQCDSGKSREFIEKTTQKHRFRNNSTTFSETIPQQHFSDFELKIIIVSELNCLIKMMRCLWVDSKFISELSHRVLVSCLIIYWYIVSKNVSIMSICTQSVFVLLEKNVFFSGGGGAGIQVGPTFFLLPLLFL